MRILLLALLFPALAAAQEKAPARTCRIVFLNPPANGPRTAILFDGVSSREVELPKMNFSKIYQIAPGEVNIRLLSKPVTKPEEVPSGAPAGKVGAGVVDFYLVASGDPTNKEFPVKMQIIDAGPQAFKQGQMMWYNLTSHSVGGQLGEQKLAMKAQTRAIIDAPAKGAESFNVNLSYLLPGDPKFYPICQTQWMHDPRSRMVLFVYGGAGKSVPEIAGFKDFREPPPKTE